MTWGTGKWGSSPWGTGSGSGLADIASAYAISMNEIQVNFTAPVLTRAPYIVGDATSPSTWQVVRDDLNQVIPVVLVTVLSPTQVVVRTLLPLPPNTATVTISAPGLRDATGLELIPTRTDDVQGLTEEAVATPAAMVSGKTFSPRDLLNRPAPTPDSSLSGSLVVVGGDYATQEGDELLRKLVYRRLTTVPGEFFHLQTYGVGLRVKEPIPISDLVKLKTKVEGEVLREDGVASATASVSLSSGLLAVQVAFFSRATGAKLQVGYTSGVGS